MTKPKNKDVKRKVAPELEEQLRTAREDLAVAERELKATLEALPSALRADKQMVSEALQLALGKLADAKLKLDAVLEP